MSSARARLTAIAVALSLFGACAAQQPSGASSTAHKSASGTVRTSFGARRQFSSGFLGYNLGFASSQVGNLDDLIASNSSFRTGTLRYPGGTLANYWNWRTRSFNAAGRARFPELAKLVGHSFGLGRFAAMLRSTRASAVIDLNVMTSSLGEQIAMLKEAVRLGIDVRYVELGNELYLPIQDYRNHFPTGGDYAALVRRWAPAIHRVVPHARIAITAAAPNAPQRMVSWNPPVLAAAHSTAVSAVTLHLYPKPAAADAVPNSVESHAALFAQAYTTSQSVDNLSRSIPAGKSIWITEANLLDLRGKWGPFGPVQGTWTHALFTTELLMLLMTDPRVDLVDVHALFGQAEIAAYSTAAGRPRLTAMGAATTALSRAASGATGATRLDFSGQPMLRRGAPALLGWQFTRRGAPSTVLLNLSAKVVTVRTADLRTPAAVAISQYSLNPATVPAERDLVPRTKIAHITVVLPPYSLTTVG